MITTTSADGTPVRAHDEGHGPPILMVGAGRDDGWRCQKIAHELPPRFRVLRLERRQYRLDLKVDPRRGSACSVAQEVDDVVAITAKVDRAPVIYGHASGGVVALEALAVAPSAFAGAVLFEPAAVVEDATADSVRTTIVQGRAAVAARRPGRALAIFAEQISGLPRWEALLAGMYTTVVPRYRRLVSCQLDDLEALDRLGMRLDAYAGITVPTVLMGAERPAMRRPRWLDALERAIPDAQRVFMHRRHRGVGIRQPNRVIAGAIATLADHVFRTNP